MTNRPPARLSFVMTMLVCLILTACSTGGGTKDPTPTPEPTATAPLAPGQKTVGELLDGIRTSFEGVSSVQTTFSTTTIVDGTPSISGAVTTEQYIAPDRRRIVISSGGQEVDEQIAIGNRIFMRGVFVQSAVAPMLGTDTWVTLDPSLVPGDTPVGNLVSYLTSPYSLVIFDVSDSLRARGVNQLGPRDVNGRTCMAWGFVDTTSFGDRLDYELTIDDAGLPCTFVERAGGVENSTTFEFNVPGLDIIAPDSAREVSGTPEG